MKDVLGKLALLVGGLLVAGIMAELIVRAAGLAPEVALIQKGRFRLSSNVRIGYEPAPLHYDGEAVPFYDYRGAGNRLGYRDYDHTVEKPAGVYRILVLGDSIGAGLRVDRYEDTFPALLESLLEARDLDVEVLNFSVSGYNTQQEVETLKERGLAYEPDLVVLTYCLNDQGIDDGHILGTLLMMELEADGVPSARITRLYTKSALFRLVRYRLLKPERPAVPRYLERYYEAVSASTVKDSIRQLGSIARERGFEALMAVVPVFEDLDRYPYEAEHRRLERFATEADLLFLDLLDPFRECREEGPVAHDAFHPTALGHRCMAEAMAELIEERIRS